MQDSKEKISSASWQIKLGWAILILLLIIIIWVLILVINFLKSINWSQINPTVIAAVITATLGTVASVSAVVIGNSLTQKREIEFQNRFKKSEAYASFVGDLIETLNSTQSQDEKNQKFIKMAKEFGRDLILWGSDETIRAYKDFREYSKDNISKKENILFVMERILLAIRKDLGHKNKNLQPGTLLTFFLKESIKEIQSKRYEK